MAADVTEEVITAAVADVARLADELRLAFTTPQRVAFGASVFVFAHGTTSPSDARGFSRIGYLASSAGVAHFLHGERTLTRRQRAQRGITCLRIFVMFCFLARAPTHSSRLEEGMLRLRLWGPGLLLLANTPLWVRRATLPGYRSGSARPLGRTSSRPATLLRLSSTCVQAPGVPDRTVSGFGR